MPHDHSSVAVAVRPSDAVNRSTADTVVSASLIPLTIQESESGLVMVRPVPPDANDHDPEVAPEAVNVWVIVWPRLAYRSLYDGLIVICAATLQWSWGTLV